MENPQLVEVDLIRELRLRRWARLNYVSPDERCRTWHPIVLQEMRRKDVELELDSRGRSLGGGYVPLSPGPDRRLHTGHTLQQTLPRICTVEELERTSID